MSRLRRTAARLSLAVVATLLCLGALECVVRWSGIAPATEFEPGAAAQGEGSFPPLSETVVERREYRTVVRTNSLGLRGPEPDRPGLIVFGDSFVFARQVDEAHTATALLGEALGTEAMNAGYQGGGTFSAAALADKVIRQFDPKQVLLLYYLGNDPADDARKPLAAAHRRRRSQPQGEIRKPPWLLVRAADHSQLASLLLVELQGRLNRLGPEAAKQNADELRFFSDPEWRSRYLRWTAQALDEFARACAGRDCRVALVPAAWQIDTWREGQTFALAGLDPPADPDVLRREVTERCPLPVLDLQPALEAARSKGRVYFRQDGHWTELGNRVAAEALETWLTTPTAAGAPRTDSDLSPTGSEASR